MGGEKSFTIIPDSALLNTLFVKRSEQNGCEKGVKEIKGSTLEDLSLNQ